MAHYAFLDENNVVIEVITGKDETELIDGLDPEIWYGNFRGKVCKRTSYNTVNNKRIAGEGEPFRKNYAGIGYFYDNKLDAFVPPRLYPSWILNEETCQWEAPATKPVETKTTGWEWDETTVSWKSFTKTAN